MWSRDLSTWPKSNNSTSHSHNALPTIVLMSPSRTPSPPRWPTLKPRTEIRVTSRPELNTVKHPQSDIIVSAKPIKAVYISRILHRLCESCSCENRYGSLYSRSELSITYISHRLLYRWHCRYSSAQDHTCGDLRHSPWPIVASLIIHVGQSH